MSKNYAFHSPEMHCGACELIVERTLAEETGVRTVKADAARSTVLVVGDFEESPEEVAARFSALLKPKGYTIAVGPAAKDKRPVATDFLVALVFASAIIAAFVGLQKVGLVNFFSPTEINLPASFLIGVIASLSTCMALVGGLLLSVAANASKAEPSARFFGNAMFHASRLGGFFVLGGVIGAIGRAFTLTPLLTVALDAMVALVMLVLGLNLLDLIPALKRLQPRLPALVSRKLLKSEKLRHGFSPALLGLITFFLPCGFTQSMQLVSLASGSFLNGALTMLAFAAGTFPVLVLISFASVNLATSRRAGVFFKTAGLIVISFALMNLMNSLAALGLVRPLISI